MSEGEELEEVNEPGGCCIAVKVWYCELNFIGRYWCRAKSFTRENCGFDFEALKAVVPEVLASVSSAFICGFCRLALRAFDAYPIGVQYGTEESEQKVYKWHRQVEIRSKQKALKPSMLAVLGGGS